MEHYATTQKGATFEAFCLSVSTRNGFRHEVEIKKNGYTIARGICRYINRTWERYTYESAIHKAVENCVLSADKAENEKLKKALKRQFDKKALPHYYR